MPNKPSKVSETQKSNQFTNNNINNKQKDIYYEEEEDTMNFGKGIIINEKSQAAYSNNQIKMPTTNTFNNNKSNSPVPQTKNNNNNSNKMGDTNDDFEKNSVNR